jgi:hypothetical protein
MEFRRLCDQGVSELPEHHAREPDWPPIR